MEIDLHFSSISGRCITDGLAEAGDLWAGGYHAKSEWEMKAVCGVGTDFREYGLGYLVMPGRRGRRQQPLGLSEL